jgi:hypothetical protein
MLKHLISFLKRVSLHRDNNRMTAKNLAAVFTPLLFLPSGEGSASDDMLALLEVLIINPQVSVTLFFFL